MSDDSIRPFVKMAFESYYSRHWSHSNPAVITCMMFKQHQQTLKDMGVTIEHLKNPNINKVRYNVDPHDHSWWISGRSPAAVVPDMSHLLTAEKPLMETNEWYAMNGTMGPASGGGYSVPIWVENAPLIPAPVLPRGPPPSNGVYIEPQEAIHINERKIKIRIGEPVPTIN